MAIECIHLLYTLFNYTLLKATMPRLIKAKRASHALFNWVIRIYPSVDYYQWYIQNGDPHTRSAVLCVSQQSVPGALLLCSSASSSADLLFAYRSCWGNRPYSSPALYLLYAYRL